MQMQIIEYYERVDKNIQDSHGWNKVYKKDFIEHRKSEKSDTSWTTKTFCTERAEKDSKYLGCRNGNEFLFSTGTYYGIESYQAVVLTSN